MRKFRIFKLYLFIFAISFIILGTDLAIWGTFLASNIILFLLTVNTTEKLRNKFFSLICFSALTILQYWFIFSIFTERTFYTPTSFFIRAILYMLLISSFLLEHFLEMKNYNNYFFHPGKNSLFLPIGGLKDFLQLLGEKRKHMRDVREFITIKNIVYLLEELRRNNSFIYTNNGALSDEYFEKVEQSFDDPNIYIILSDSGSVPSNFFKIFTAESHNHASISFDRELYTLISYNGGERINPPGLNPELLTYLMKYPDSSVYVYSLKVSPEQKRKMIEKVREINDTGSAYNLMGILLRNSYKPNILYCSQFVYSLLEYADANYFEKKSKNIRPSELIELDYERKLKFEEVIKF